MASPLTLFGRGRDPSHVCYHYEDCELHLRSVMADILSKLPQHLEQDTMNYIARGPKAVVEPRNVDERIRRYTRKKLGLHKVETGDALTLWPEDD